MELYLVQSVHQLYLLYVWRLMCACHAWRGASWMVAMENILLLEERKDSVFFLETIFFASACTSSRVRIFMQVVNFRRESNLLLSVGKK